AVPQDLHVVVRVDVDEPGADDLAGRVDLARGLVRGGAHRDDLAVPDADVAHEAGCARAVDDRPAGDLQVVCHVGSFAPSSTSGIRAARGHPLEVSPNI